MRFSIDKSRLEDFRSHFKMANFGTNEAFEKLGKADDAVSLAENALSKIDHEGRNIRGYRDARNSAVEALADARNKRDQAHERYVEASRLSSYFGGLHDRCQRYADQAAAAEGASKRARIEDSAVAAANAAHAGRMADGGRQ